MKKANEFTDAVLEDFFASYKRQEQQLPIPEFPEPRKGIKKSKLAILGIAASILIGFFYIENSREEITLVQDVLVISLEKNEEQDPIIVVTTTTSMDIWESPTASLLTEF
ncbi:hypothetical protein [Cyclobacterium xiamenense]|jgi:hypothetical protein|uniref:hypothetical protein n=1 Tax=Cyclobacterium xiamenense TaxID=1297121 RepID=UPI0035CF334F